MSTIFISYRRKESALHARAVYERLNNEPDFKDRVFMDVESIGKFVDFQARIEQQLQGCRVLLALIGPKWHCITDKQGRIRLHLEQDWIRIEILTAMKHGIPVLPILLDDADPPDPDDLPEVLRPLLKTNALPLDMGRYFKHGMQDLVEEIRKILSVSVPERVDDLPTVKQVKKDALAGLKKLMADSTQTQANPPIQVVPAVQVIPRSSAPRLPCAKAQGDHDEFETPWADVDICGVTQRFRWIKPGTFLMGCDPDDPDGQDSEKPQHRVTLTRGFWLADTACTQRLWQAVTGQNPSHFKGSIFKGSAKLPVDKVSWDAVTGLFLPKVTQVLGVQAALPTEAEWEYACRAGTQTPYWFGQTLTAQQANFAWSGRDKTVEVEALPANGWGLYQMHGNVWEWCAGSQRRYDSQAVTDPPDGQDQNSRALRGGSWNFSPGLARAAYRNRNHRDIGYNAPCGFRFALRSTSPG